MRDIWIALVLALAAFRASAADKPVVAPPEAWVKPAPATPIPAPTDAAIRWLLFDEQARFGPAGDSVYFESKVLAQTPQGLGPMGTIALAWNPETDSMTVHRVDIIRGGTVIDLLAGHDFTVIRRETNLDMAVLDGVLTATLQVEGLQVGDVLDLAFTRNRNDPLMAGRSETLMGALPNVPIGRLRLRGSWSKPKAMRWRAGDGLDAPKVTTAGATTAVEDDLSDVQPITFPKGAPRRFLRGRELEFGEFASWAEVSGLFAPLYDKAATLGPGSPLKAEVAAIRAASADPEVQALAALALVQDKVRYVFLGMNDGGLIPADADLTWSRRFGDCKGKTALLLALLRDLGIEAQPALVSSENGDGLDSRLPSVGAFDHIIVRAKIAGEVLWLDGTRTGDRDRRDLVSAPFHWALPVQASGAALLALSQPPLERPRSTITYALDASAGLDLPASVKASTVLRGDDATSLRLILANGQPDAVEHALKDYWKGLNSLLDPKHVSARFDPVSGEELLTMDGQATLSWEAVPGEAARRYAINGVDLGWKADFRRDPGPHSDAPYAVAHPAYAQVVETVTLPRGGKGFTVDGADVDTTAAGIRFTRKARIDKGVLSVETSVRSLTDEFPAAQADAAAKTLSDLADNTLYVRAPQSLSAPPIAEALATEPTTAAGFIDRGSARIDRGRYDQAIADFDKAIALDPKAARAYADRGIARFWTSERALAKADFDTAASLDPNDPIVFHGDGLLQMVAGHFSRAVVAFTRAIDRTPDDAFAFADRAKAWWNLGDAENTLADSAEALRLNPQALDLRTLRARVFASEGRSDQAMAEWDAAIAARPDDPAMRYVRARGLWAMGRAPEARRDMEAVIAAKPAVNGYIARASFRESSEVDAKLADLDAALTLSPKSPAAWMARVQVFLDRKEGARALAEAGRALLLRPDDPDLLLSRAQAYVVLGESARARQAFAQVRAMARGDGGRFNALCWSQATVGFDLPDALSDCDAALKIDPDAAAALDSRGFVQFPLGRLDLALADYDAALKIDPHLAASLYGRGLVDLKLGLNAQGAADMAAARALYAPIVADFAAYGLSP